MALLSVAFLVTGLLFLVTAAIGAVRLPDFYTRSHALAVTDTLGTFLILVGIAIPQGSSISTVKLLLLGLFIYIANPTITHVFVQAALRSGLKPWTRKESAE